MAARVGKTDQNWSAPISMLAPRTSPSISLAGAYVVRPRPIAGELADSAKRAIPRGARRSGEQRRRVNGRAIAQALTQLEADNRVSADQIVLVGIATARRALLRIAVLVINHDIVVHPDVISPSAGEVEVAAAHDDAGHRRRHRIVDDLDVGRVSRAAVLAARASRVWTVDVQVKEVLMM